MLLQRLRHFLLTFLTGFILKGRKKNFFFDGRVNFQLLQNFLRDCSLIFPPRRLIIFKQAIDELMIRL